MKQHFGLVGHISPVGLDVTLICYGLEHYCSLPGYFCKPTRMVDENIERNRSAIDNGIPTVYFQR
jgi:hypothetical protein